MRNAPPGDVPRFLAAAFKHPVLSKDDERTLAKKATAKRGRKDRRLDARNDLVSHNLRFVLGQAIKHARRSGGRLELDDAFQEGMIGEIESVSRFKVEKGFRLSTYAGWWVRHHISRADQDTGRTIRIPVHALEGRHKIERAIGAFIQKEHRAPTSAEISAETGIDIGKVEHLLAMPYAEPYSMDAPVGDEDGRTLGDVIADTSESPEDRIEDIEHADLCEKLKVAMLRLSETERFILDCRFRKEWTLVQTAEALAPMNGRILSRERIRQLESQAIDKLRRHMLR